MKPTKLAELANDPPIFKIGLPAYLRLTEDPVHPERNGKVVRTSKLVAIHYGHVALTLETRNSFYRIQLPQ